MGFSYGCDKGRNRMLFCFGGRELLELLLFQSVFPAPFFSPPATVCPGFKATAHGGRVRKAFAGQEKRKGQRPPGPFSFARCNAERMG